MKEIILLKYGEIALKGKNRNTFEDTLCRNIRKKIEGGLECDITRAQSTIYMVPRPETDVDALMDEMKKVFGIASISRAVEAKKDFEDIKEKSIEYLKKILGRVATFKVESKRSDKSFPMKSPELSRELGGHILDNFPHLLVDVHSPDVVVTCEIRDFSAYVHAEKIKGAGGIPVGCSGRAMLLLSGGIDSPVAGYMLAKRGVSVMAVHFESPPYTSERAALKVENLAKKITQYCGTIRLNNVHFTKAQEEIRSKCKDEYFTVIMRRVMMMVAEKLADRSDCTALVTGESLGQVASQTLAAISCTNAATEMPVLRPLIALDKVEIVEIARKIDTFEISIQPYEDCCTVFTPKRPRTKPSLEHILEEESKIDIKQLVEDCVDNTKGKTLYMNHKQRGV